MSSAAPTAVEVQARFIRPLSARDIRGLAWLGADLMALDAASGRLMLVDPQTDDTRVVNDGACEQMRGARGLAIGAGALWYTTDAGLHRVPWPPDLGVPPDLSAPADPGTPVGPASTRDPGAPRNPGDPPAPGAPRDPAAPLDLRVGAGALALPVERAGAVAVWGDELYLVADRRLLALDGSDPTLPARRAVDLPGVGAKGLAATQASLWMSDDVEQTVYCLDRASLGQRFMVVTPLEGPTALSARRPHGAQVDHVHVAYYADEPYLFDNPWIDPSWDVRYRDRALVHQLCVHHDPTVRRAWSTGHRIQMHYLAEVEPDPDVPTLTGVQWRMSLPIETARQRMISVRPIGMPFRIEHEEGQPVAVFDVGDLDARSRPVLGWSATLELFGIKHLVTPEDLADAPPLPAEMAARYLVDDEDLDLGAPEVDEATAVAVHGEENLLRQARAIRSHVYDRLEYEMGNADTPVAVLARGTGSCGEYVGTMMALMRTAGLACRVAGRYKCPYEPWNRGPLYPDFNHVWVDLFLPGYGWVPVESNPDDVVDGGPYPDRFFLGLPWRHVEVGKDISFEKVTHDAGGRRRRIGARRLSRNHIRFDVLAEIAPAAPPSPAREAGG